MAGEHSEGQRADLVGRVPAGDDAVRADEDGGEAAGGQQGGRRTVTHQRGRDGVGGELVGRQAAALVVGPRLGAVAA